MALIVLAGLTACSKTHGSKPRSQVVAQVNDQEITQTQLNQKLRTAQTAVTQRQAVDALIDEELLVQDALNNKLDRDPAVVQTIEHTRRQILARAYLDRMVFPKSPVTVTQLQDYYKKNPNLFENRKVFKLTVFTLPTVDMKESLQGDIDRANSADQVRVALEKQGIKFETQLRNSSAEQLPTDLLPQFAASHPGDVLIAKQKDGKTLFIVVNEIEASPLTFELAKPAIEEYLLTSRNARSLKEHLKHARAAAQISYSDDKQKHAQL